MGLKERKHCQIGEERQGVVSFSIFPHRMQQRLSTKDERDIFVSLLRGGHLLQLFCFFPSLFYFILFTNRTATTHTNWKARLSYFKTKKKTRKNHTSPTFFLFLCRFFVWTLSIFVFVRVSWGVDAAYPVSFFVCFHLKKESLFYLREFLLIFLSPPSKHTFSFSRFGISRSGKLLVDDDRGDGLFIFFNSSHYFFLLSYNSKFNIHIQEI